MERREGKLTAETAEGDRNSGNLTKRGCLCVRCISICAVQVILTTMHCLVLCAALGPRERTQEGLTARGESATAK